MTPAEQIEEEFPGWGAFQSDAGRWWASDHRITHEQRRIGYSATVDADTYEELRDAVKGELERRKPLNTHLVSA